MAEPEDGESRMGAETFRRGQERTCAEDLEEAGWGVIPDHSSGSHNLMDSLYMNTLILMI